MPVIERRNKKMKGYCNKCNKFIEDMNGNEIDEFKEYKEFCCSTCINEEMLEDDKEIKRLNKNLKELYKRLTDETGEHGLEIVGCIVDNEIELEKFCNQ